MRNPIFTIFLAALTLAAPPGQAEDASQTPAQDLATLKQRAATSQEALYELVQVASQLQSGIGLNDLLGGLLNVSPDGMGSGLRYSAAARVRLAQMRADRYATILSNDLDGDGSVSRDEIADTLAFGQSRRTGAAETLITYDKDRNDILSPDEIRTAVTDVRDPNGGRRDNMRIAAILDFDSDGTLTPAEMDRVTAALKLPEALQ